ncbi:hypothetical protein VUR80DRAFT_3248 [Thermomyces stellatus]
MLGYEDSSDGRQRTDPGPFSRCPYLLGHRRRLGSGGGHGHGESVAPPEVASLATPPPSGALEQDRNEQTRSTGASKPQARSGERRDSLLDHPSLRERLRGDSDGRLGTTVRSSEEALGQGTKTWLAQVLQVTSRGTGTRAKGGRTQRRSLRARLQSTDGGDGTPLRANAWRFAGGHAAISGRRPGPNRSRPALNSPPGVREERGEG